MTKQELEMCINEYGRDIYSFCRHLAYDPRDADDLYQDTFLTAVEHRDRIDCEDNPKSYLLSIAFRIWKNRKRKFAWRKRIADVRSVADARDFDRGNPEEVSVEDRILGRERDDMVRRAVEGLPDSLKITVLLYYMEELSTSQIAKIMRIPAGTVLSRLHRARKILREKLEEILDE